MMLEHASRFVLGLHILLQLPVLEGLETTADVKMAPGVRSHGV